MRPDLQTSLTVRIEADKDPIDFKTFENPDLHIQLHNTALVNGLLKLSMFDGTLIKVPVGSKENPTEVEFYSFNLRKNGKIVPELSKIIQLAWIDAIHETSRKMVDTGENFLSAEITSSLDDAADLIELRRFLLNAFNLESKKKKFAQLLFHHQDYSSLRN